jgi:hypothetical protein
MRQNEANLEENDSDTAVRPDEELEGDPRGDNNRQVRDDSHDDSSGEQAHSLGSAAENLGRVRWLLKHNRSIH